jgi:Trk K+ transport system NAD-binding subunit
VKNNSLWIILHRLRWPLIVIVTTYTVAIIGLLLIPGVDDNGNSYHMSIFDAYYFITYTATTIGFGEIPYSFTHAQRIWVSMSIYTVVIGWFYSIGVVVSLLQDKLFLNELAKANFKRQVKNIDRPFIIVLGYSYMTDQIIKKIQKTNLRAVVIEKDQARADMLMLEGYTTHVPVLVADAHQVTSLELAGIKRLNCKGLVSLFEDDNLNLRVALTAKSLNKNIRLAIKSTSHHHTDNLIDIGVEIVENPFLIIAKHMQMALNAPNLLKIERWIYKIGLLSDSLPKLPQGKYIICGYGRMGRHIFEIFEKNGIKSAFIEINESYKNNSSNNKEHILYADGDDKDSLLNAGIMDSVAIIAGTNDDTINLSILTTAKKLNKDIITIARENEFEDNSIFINAKIDHIFMPSRILINKTSNALLNPLSDIFINLLQTKDEAWGQSLVNRLITTIDEQPKIFEITINKKYAPEIYNYLNNTKKSLNLEIFHQSLRNRTQSNNIVPLLIKQKEEIILLPNWDTIINENDKILFACDENAREDMLYIAQNLYEFEYILTGKEKQTIFNFNKG